MSSRKLFELLYDYYDEPHITYEELRDRAQDLFYTQNQEYGFNPILAGLIMNLHEVEDGFISKDVVDGYIEGVLAIFAPCPVLENIKTESCNTTDFAQIKESNR